MSLISHIRLEFLFLFWSWAHTFHMHTRFWTIIPFVRHHWFQSHTHNCHQFVKHFSSCSLTERRTYIVGIKWCALIKTTKRKTANAFDCVALTLVNYDRFSSYSVQLWACKCDVDDDYVSQCADNDCFFFLLKSCRIHSFQTIWFCLFKTFFFIWFLSWLTFVIWLMRRFSFIHLLAFLIE